MRVFVQRAEPKVHLPELIRATQRYFDATLDVLSLEVGRSGAGDRAELELRSDQHGYSGRFTIRARMASPYDWSDARDAEARGRAAGMSLLAQRCPTIWDVEPVAEDNELARLHLCAILASVALGPVLPDDGSTLFGVRGAMERVQRLLAG